MALAYSPSTGVVLTETVIEAQQDMRYFLGMASTFHDLYAQPVASLPVGTAVTADISYHFNAVLGEYRFPKVTVAEVVGDVSQEFLVNLREQLLPFYESLDAPPI